TVPSKADKKRAVRLAKLVPGVRKVHDSLTIDANASSSGDNEPSNARNLPAKPKTTATAPRSRPGAVGTNRAAAPANRTTTGESNSVATADPAKGKPASGETHLGSNSSGATGGIAGAAASAS